MNYQYLTCPEGDAAAIVAYMRRRKIPFRRLRRSWCDLLKIWQVQFRIPRNVRPHQWKLELA